MEATALVSWRQAGRLTNVATARPRPTNLACRLVCKHDMLFNCRAAARSPSFKARRPGTDRPYGHGPLNPVASALYKSIVRGCTCTHSANQACLHARPQLQLTSQSGRTHIYLWQTHMDSLGFSYLLLSYHNGGLRNLRKNGQRYYSYYKHITLSIFTHLNIFYCLLHVYRYINTSRGTWQEPRLAPT